MKKQVTFDMLYVAADFIYANSTKAEREIIFREIERGRKEDKGFTDNDRHSYFRKTFNKKILKKISKTY